MLEDRGQGNMYGTLMICCLIQELFYLCGGPGTGEGGGPGMQGLRKKDRSVLGEAGGDSSCSP